MGYEITLRHSGGRWSVYDDDSGRTVQTDAAGILGVVSALVDAYELEQADFRRLKEGGGGPCKHCGSQMDPSRYADYCVPCSWDQVWERSV